MRWGLQKDSEGKWLTTTDANLFFRLLALILNRRVTIETNEARLTSSGWQIKLEIAKGAKEKK